jgi:alpha-galactosidase
MPAVSAKILCAVALLGLAAANDNGKALTPPLGWRSWNLYGAKVSQDLITSIMDGVVAKAGLVNGEQKSLCDLGFCDVGLDDNWQSCHDPAAEKGMNYHDKDGNPIVNTNLFPDFKKMTDHAHSLGLTSGWYGNNCICSDHCSGDQCDAQIRGDVAAFVKYGFDSWKLDGCGNEHDLVSFNKYVTAAGKNITVENCHWGRVVPFKPDRSLPPAEGCPWNFYRSSGDVRASYASVLGNLATVMPLHQANLSYPGCWAYPDMLQVGCQHGPGGASDPGLSEAETRTHYGAWAIVSSPLTLSHDVNNATVTAQIWDVISNTEVLAVNQAYVGDSGGQYDASEELLEHTDAFIEAPENGEPRVSAPKHQYLYKPIGGGKVAVLLMNSDSATATLEADFSKVPGVTCTTCSVRDIWAQKDLGSFDGKWSGSVESHDAAFLVISA